jgi:hypothetical protein
VHFFSRLGLSLECHSCSITVVKNPKKSTMFHLSHPITPMDQKMLVGGLEHDLNILWKNHPK